MAVHNAATYLRECIDSILNQTFTDFDTPTIESD